MIILELGFDFTLASSSLPEILSDIIQLSPKVLSLKIVLGYLHFALLYLLPELRLLIFCQLQSHRLHCFRPSGDHFLGGWELLINLLAVRDDSSHLLVSLLGLPLEFDEVLALVGDLLSELPVLHLHLIALLLVLVQVLLQFLHLCLVALDLLNPVGLGLEPLPLLGDDPVPHLL